MNTYHRRLIVMSYIPTKLPKFDTSQQYRNYMHTLGYMLDYGLNRDQGEDTLQVVRCSLREDEILRQYPKPINEFQEKWEDGTRRYTNSNAQRVDEVLNTLSQQSTGHTFTMAAINRGDDWSTHS